MIGKEKRDAVAAISPSPSAASCVPAKRLQSRSLRNFPVLHRNATGTQAKLPRPAAGEWNAGSVRRRKSFAPRLRTRMGAPASYSFVTRGPGPRWRAWRRGFGSCQLGQGRVGRQSLRRWKSSAQRSGALRPGATLLKDSVANAGEARTDVGGGKIEPPRLFAWLGGASIVPPSHAGA